MSTIITISNEKGIAAKTAIKKALKQKEVELFRPAFKNSSTNYNDCRLFIQGKSTRGIQVLIDKESIDICVNIMSSSEDIKLAISTAKIFVKLCNTSILVEGHPYLIPSDQIDDGILENVLFKNQLAGVEYLKFMSSKNEEVQIPGLFADYWPRPELLKDTDIDPIDLHMDLMVDFVGIQNLESDGVRITNPITVSKGGKEKIIIVLTENHMQLVKKCDYVVLCKISTEQFISIPINDFMDNLNVDCEKIDNVQFIFPAMEEKEFDLFFSKMNKYEQEIG